MILCRRLDAHHRVCKTPRFPRKVSYAAGYRHRVLLGAGGNVGDTKRRFEHLWVYLQRHPLLKPLRSGAILRNPPFGYTEQEDFENTVIEIATSLEPRALLRLVWRIEKRFGRKRSFPNAPRTLDLDIIFFDNRKVHYKELVIPHPYWRVRPSVTIPLKTLPGAGQTLRRRYENFDF